MTDRDKWAWLRNACITSALVCIALESYLAAIVAVLFAILCQIIRMEYPQ